MNNDSGVVLAGCGAMVFVVLGNILLWGAVIWGVATFVLPYLSFWH